MPTWDSPEQIVEGCIKTQLAILSGYRGSQRIDKQKTREALTPKHAAISLAGEPTLYPEIGELIQTFHRRGFTTFLVSNGTNPSVISKLSTEPTQLYISLCAPDKQTFKRVCRP
jgi:tRNA wybutosine-synthesizing protein 1